MIWSLVLVVTACGSNKNREQVFSLKLLNAADHLVYPLENSYKARTKVTITTYAVKGADLNIYLDGSEISQTSAGKTNWTYEFQMPYKNCTLEFKVESDNPLYGKRMSEYVEIEDVLIPTEYFTCDLSEIDKDDAFDLTTIKSNPNLTIGNSYSLNFEYGEIIKADLPNKDVFSSYYEINTLKQDTNRNNQYSHYLSDNDETFQYQQVVNGNGYLLNEDNTSLSASKLTVDFGSSNTNVGDYTPDSFKLLTDDSINETYKQGTKNELTYLSISGNYVDSSIAEYNQIQCQIIYVIDGDSIVAWYYKEVASNLTKAGTWEKEVYCRSYQNEIPIIDVNILDSLATK